MLGEPAVGDSLSLARAFRDHAAARVLVVAAPAVGSAAVSPRPLSLAFCVWCRFVEKPFFFLLNGGIANGLVVDLRCHRGGKKVDKNDDLSERESGGEFCVTHSHVSRA